MRKLIAILISIATILACQASVHPTKLEAAISAAKSAVVRLEVPGRICTAFHVGDDVFITAAHCLDGQNLIFLRAEDNSGYLSVPIIVDKKTDLATLKSKTHFNGGTLKIWRAARPDLGAELVAAGYPGYYEMRFIFETGFLKDFIVVKDVRMILSSELGYPGESGGPVLDVKSGQIVGVNDQIGEVMETLDPDSKTPVHYHKTLTLIVGFPEVLSILERSQTQLAHTGGL